HKPAHQPIGARAPPSVPSSKPRAVDAAGIRLGGGCDLRDSEAPGIQRAAVDFPGPPGRAPAGPPGVRPSPLWGANARIPRIGSRPVGAAYPTRRQFPRRSEARPLDRRAVEAIDTVAIDTGAIRTGAIKTGATEPAQRRCGLRGALSKPNQRLPVRH